MRPRLALFPKWGANAGRPQMGRALKRERDFNPSAALASLFSAPNGASSQMGRNSERPQMGRTSQRRLKRDGVKKNGTGPQKRAVIVPAPQVTRRGKVTARF